VIPARKCYPTGDTGIRVFTLFTTSYRTPSGATTPARISQPAGICGVSRSFLSVQLIERKRLLRSCRDGVKRPPSIPRQRSVGSQPRADSSVAKTRAGMPEDQNSKRKSLPKASAQRLGASLQQLEALHKSSGTNSHMRISDGKRIKLPRNPPSDNAQSAGHAAKKRARLDTDFSTLQEDDGISGNTRLFDLSDSDEFPDLHELVLASVHGAEGAQRRLPSCNSDYSDSDMDAMVRDAHLEGISPTETSTTRTQNSSHFGPVKSVPSKRKRSIEVVDDLTTTQGSVASPQSQRSHLLPQVRAQR
jgi:hypothetical protein